MPYRIKNEYAKQAVLVTNIGDEAVNLKGQDLKKILPATRKAPERTQIIRGATQKDLEAAHAAGNPCVEEYAEAEKPVVAKP